MKHRIGQNVLTPETAAMSSALPDGGMRRAVNGRAVNGRAVN